MPTFIIGSVGIGIFQQAVRLHLGASFCQVETVTDTGHKHRMYEQCARPLELSRLSSRTHYFPQRVVGYRPTYLCFLRLSGCRPFSQCPLTKHKYVGRYGLSARSSDTLGGLVLNEALSHRRQPCYRYRSRGSAKVRRAARVPLLRRQDSTSSTSWNEAWPEIRPFGRSSADRRFLSRPP